ERGLNLPACQNDGVITADRMKSKGRLDEAQVFVGGQATRDQMERAITRWLPSVSRPGDTVFIYISTHGGQDEGDGGEEARSTRDDHLDEFLLPHDYIGPEMLDELRRDLRTGKPVDPWARRWIERVTNELGDWPDRETNTQAWKRWMQQAEPILARRTGISHDEVGHWGQRLDRPQVGRIPHTSHTAR